MDRDFRVPGLGEVAIRCADLAAMMRYQERAPGDTSPRIAL
jgi:hypothetical protein